MLYEPLQMLYGCHKSYTWWSETLRKSIYGTHKAFAEVHKASAEVHICLAFEEKHPPGRPIKNLRMPTQKAITIPNFVK